MAATTSAPAATMTPAPSGLPAVAITLGCAPLQGGPRPRPPTGGDNEAIKAKKSGTRRQEALMVSLAEATTSAAGSLTSGGDHLSTDDSDNLCTGQRRLPQHARRGPRSCSLIAVRTRPSKNAVATLAAYDVLYDPQCGRWAGEAVDVADPRTARPSPVRWTDSHALAKAAGGSVGGGAKAIQPKGPDTLQLTPCGQLAPRSRGSPPPQGW
jgi:hypothetical protein